MPVMREPSMIELEWLWKPMVVAVPTIVGIWTLFGVGMIFGWLGDILDRWLPAFIQKPLYGCLPCMSSFWGSTIWFLMDGRVELAWPVFCLALCGILKIVSDNFLRHE